MIVAAKIGRRIDIWLFDTRAAAFHNPRIPVRWRPFHLALLLLQAFWLNVIVPGHTRGMILIPGTAFPCDGGAKSKSCCGDPPSHDGKSHQPTPYERAHCAICFFAARLSLPEVISCQLEPLALHELIPFPAPESASVVAFVSAHQCRGPPIIPT